jgi:hypothetical protein
MASKGISINEACRLLGKSAGEVWAMVAAGRLRHRRVNTRAGKSGHIVIRRSDVAALLPPTLTPMSPTLRKSRMQDVIKTLEKEAKRSEFLVGWTGKDHRPPTPAPTHTDGSPEFNGACRYARAENSPPAGKLA